VDRDPSERVGEREKFPGVWVDIRQGRRHLPPYVIEGTAATHFDYTSLA